MTSAYDVASNVTQSVDANANAVSNPVLGLTSITCDGSTRLARWAYLEDCGIAEVVADTGPLETGLRAYPRRRSGRGTVDAERASRWTHRLTLTSGHQSRSTPTAHKSGLSGFGAQLNNVGAGVQHDVSLVVLLR